MTDWENFETKCPSCDNNKMCTWVHSSDGYQEKINKDGEIRCNNKSCHYYNNPAFIMEWKFECGQHGDYWKPKANRVFTAIGMVSSITNLSKAETEKLFSRIMKYA